MSKLERLPRFAWRLLRFLPPRLAYSVGLGSLAGSAVLLLKTIGRKSGLARVTPLLYDEIDGIIYVASARGTKADWYRNLEANPNVEIIIGSRKLKGCAELITDPCQIANFLEHRLKLHPTLMSAVLRVQGVDSMPTREKLEEYAQRRALVAIRTTEAA